MGLSVPKQEGLLKWVNTFPIESDVKSMTELSDGRILAKVLGDIDPAFKTQAFPKAQYLPAVIRGISDYVDAECKELSPLLKTPELKAFLHNGYTANMFELLAVVLMVAVHGSRREDYIRAIQGLDSLTQKEIMDIIQKKAMECQSENDEAANQQDRSELNDAELDFEVKYSGLIATNKSLEKEKQNLKKQLADMDSRLGTLQIHNESLRSELSGVQTELETASKDSDRAAHIKSLESKVRDQEELIANQEGQIGQDQAEKSKLRRENERFASISEKYQQLQDDYTELKQHNIDLTKKANTVDRFKQKLESQRDFEEINKNLEYEIEDLRKQIRDHESLKRRNETLENTHLQFQKSLSKREMEIFEVTNQKKHLEGEAFELQRRIAVLEERKEQDEAFIHDLQGQVTTRGFVPGTPSTTSGHTNNLEAELNESSAVTRSEFENARLKAEILVLKGNAGVAQENASLRLQLEDVARARKQLEGKCQDLFDKNVVANQQVTAILEASAGEGSVKAVESAQVFGPLKLLTPEYYRSEAFSTLRRTQQETVEALETSTKKARELEAELESTKRELLIASNDLSMVSEEDVAALELLKTTHGTIYSSIETELRELQARYKALVVNNEQERAHLVQSILDKDKLMLAGGPEAPKPAQLTQEMPEDKLRLQDDLAVAQKSIDAKDKTIQELGARLMELESGNNDAQKAALDQENTNLKRENAMMTTAWYDLTLRLQSNTVVLTRRADAPRSWINKQRQAVSGSYRR